jgi:two-component system, sensor histidine kinase LadS
MRTYPVLVLFWIYSFACLAAQPIILNDLKDQAFSLRLEKMEVLEDISKKWTLKDVLKKNYEFSVPLRNQFNSEGKYIFGKRNKAAYWIRFTIVNNATVNKNWLIEFLDFNIDRIDLYFPDVSGNYTPQTSGFSFHFLNRPFKHKNFEFDVPLNKSPAVCYIRIEPGIANILSADLKTYTSFINYSLTEYYLLGLFYGFILIMGMYNLILFINIGERQYLFYVFYVICVGLSSMCHDGTGFQYLWPGWPDWSDHIQTFSLFGMVIWTIFYSQWFLNTRFRTPLINKILNGLQVVAIGLFLFVQTFSWDYSLFLIPVAAFPFLLIYLTGIKIYIEGFKPGRFFLMAYTFFFLGFIIRSLTLFNFLEGNIFTIYSYNMGVLLEMMLFSIAIGDRIKTMKQDKEKALMEKETAQQQTIYQLRENEKLKDKVNRELEAKVNQRTKELNDKNSELETSNEKLKELTDKVNQWNVRLDLDNRKLQNHMKELSQARVLLKDVDFDEFSNIFPDENSCFKYLADLKWTNGYKCRKCFNANFGKGKGLFSRRCTKCNYDESATSDTLFHRLKFPITKAFYMVYLVSIKDKDITSDELSEILSLRRETCWSFKKKITIAKKNNKKTGKAEAADGWGALALISVTIKN